MSLLLLVATLGGASWPLIFLIVSLILLFIAAFILDGVGSRPRIHFLSAGVFFAVLALAVS